MLWEFKLKLAEGLAEGSEQKQSEVTSRNSTSQPRQVRAKRSKSRNSASQPPKDACNSAPPLIKVHDIGVQLGIYVTEAFSSGPLRSHMICGAVQDGHLSLWWFDRVGVVRTKFVNLKTSDGLGRLTMLFYHLTRLGRRGWGFIYRPELEKTPPHLRPKPSTSRYATRSTTTTIKTASTASNPSVTPDDSQDINASVIRSSTEKTENREADRKGDESRAKFRRTNPFFGWTITVKDCRVRIGQSVYRQYGLFSRGVYVADGEMDLKGGKGKERMNVVVKFSWQLLGLPQEEELTKRAQDMAGNNTEMRRRLPFVHAQEVWNSTGSGFRNNENLNLTSDKDRQLCVLVAERLDRLDTIDNGEDLKKVVVYVAHCEWAFIRS